MNVLSPLGDPIGPAVENWRPPRRPLRADLNGAWTAVESLTPEEHGESLFDAYGEDAEGRIWTYLPYGPFEDRHLFDDWLDEVSAESDPMFFAIRNASDGRVGGLASYLRIQPRIGSIEIGHLNFSPRLQRSPAATEALYLMISQAFALGYRRCEWKCDSLNAPSRRAAQRLGFSYEGVHRQAVVVKGRNRDTAWYSILDHEWPALNAAFETWLDAGNFTADGRQKLRLSDLTGPHLSSMG